MTEDDKKYVDDLRAFIVELDDAINDIGILESGEEIGQWGEIKAIVESYLNNFA